MRILFTPLAVHTHVLPMVPFAWACRAAGHDVQFAAQPRVSDSIARCGFTTFEVGASCDFQDEAVAFLRQRPDLLRNAGRPKVVGRPPGGSFIQPWIKTAGVIAPDLIPFARWWKPDIVVSDPMFYAGPLLAEVLGVPMVRFLWGPDWSKSGFGMGGVEENATEPVLWPPELIELYESYGARTEVDFAEFTIDPFPPSLQVPGLANRVTMRQIPFNGSGTVPAWLTEPPRRPRVGVTWGTTTTVYMGEEAFLVGQLLDGLADLDVEVVLAISSTDLSRLGEVPHNVRVVEFLPLDVLLPTCAGLVNQGGGGGMVTAAVHGVPQVVIPLMADQPTNAGLIAATGAGIRLNAETLTAPDVKEAVGSIVFDPEPRAAAQRISAEIRTLPHPTEIVDRVVGLVG